jgi:proline iminopeptidase
MKIIILTLFLASTIISNELYIKTFGDKNSTAIIFLHGGPGYNSANFEATSAQRLSEKGFFVICYDRRGEGRSTDKNAKYTFDESIKDITFILDFFSLEKASLIGHSFGGMLAIKFAEKFPDKIDKLFLVGAPINLQNSYKNIISKCEKIYSENGDKMNLGYINMLKEMDTSSIEYSAYSFMHAMQNGFYSPKEISDEAKKVYKELQSNQQLAMYSTMMTEQAPKGFWENEKYTTLNLSNDLKKLVNDGIKVLGIYGKDDGLYSAEIVDSIAEIIGENNLYYLDNASHNVYIDRQLDFFEILNKAK